MRYRQLIQVHGFKVLLKSNIKKNSLSSLFLLSGQILVMESSVSSAVFVIKEEHPLVRKMKEVEINMKKNGGKPLMNATQFGKHHYNSRGLFCDPNIIANNKERCFRNPAVVNHNSSQTLKLLRYHNIHTRTITSPSQLPNLIQSQNFFDYNCFYPLFAINITSETICSKPSPQQLSKPTQKSIGFRYKI